MNKLLIALAAVFGFAFLAPTTAEAGGYRTRTTCDSYGYTVNWQYRCVGHRSCGTPIFRWIVVSRYAPRHYHGGYGYRSHYHGGYSHRGHYHGGYRRPHYHGGHGHRHHGRGRR